MYSPFWLTDLVSENSKSSGKTTGVRSPRSEYSLTLNISRKKLTERWTNHAELKSRTAFARPWFALVRCDSVRNSVYSPFHSRSSRNLEYEWFSRIQPPVKKLKGGEGVLIGFFLCLTLVNLWMRKKKI